MSRWGPYVEQRLDDLKHGKDREYWEGEWPGPVTIASAWSWACDVFAEDTPTPSVVPTADGWVCFEWHKGGWDIEMEIDPESHAGVWCHHRADGRMEDLDLDKAADREKLQALLAELA